MGLPSTCAPGSRFTFGPVVATSRFCFRKEVGTSLAPPTPLFPLIPWGPPSVSSKTTREEADASPLRTLPPPEGAVVTFTVQDALLEAAVGSIAQPPPPRLMTFNPRKQATHPLGHALDTAFLLVFFWFISIKCFF